MHHDIRFSLKPGTNNRTYLVDHANRGSVLKVYSGEVDMAEAIEFMQSLIASEEESMSEAEAELVKAEEEARAVMLKLEKELHDLQCGDAIFDDAVGHMFDAAYKHWLVAWKAVPEHLRTMGPF